MHQQSKVPCVDNLEVLVDCCYVVKVQEENFEQELSRTIGELCPQWFAALVLYAGGLAYQKMVREALNTEVQRRTWSFLNQDTRRRK